MSFFYINLDMDTKKRLALPKFLRYTDTFDPLTSNMYYELKNLRRGGQYRIVGDEGRPDIVSYKIYKDTQYWWILMFYNDIVFLEDITNGRLINYPSIDAIEDYYFGLKVNQLNQGEF